MLLCCSNHAFSQYTGGSGDGFASIKTTINTQLVEIASPQKVVIANNKIRMSDNAEAEIRLFNVAGKLLQIGSKELNFTNNRGIIIYQIKTDNNKIFTGKLWVE